MDLNFTWDRIKAKRNLQKHGISFERAKQVFFDPHLIVVEDREVDDEMRYQAIGYAGSGLLLVVHVDRSEENREIILAADSLYFFSPASGGMGAVNTFPQRLHLSFSSS
jgi:uncharacterized DUF497 family protein